MSTHPLWNPFETPSPEEIEAARVSAAQPETVAVEAPDPAWAQWYAAARDRIVAALGEPSAIRRLDAVRHPE